MAQAADFVRQGMMNTPPAGFTAAGGGAAKALIRHPRGPELFNFPLLFGLRIFTEFEGADGKSIAPPVFVFGRAFFR